MKLRIQIMIVGIIVINGLGFLLFNRADLYNEFGFRMIGWHLILSLLGSLFYFLWDQKESQK